MSLIVIMSLVNFKIEASSNLINTMDNYTYFITTIITKAFHTLSKANWYYLRHLTHSLCGDVSGARAAFPDAICVWSSPYLTLERVPRAGCTISIAWVFVLWRCSRLIVYVSYYSNGELAFHVVVMLIYNLIRKIGF